MTPQEHKSLTTELGRLKAEIDRLKLDIKEREGLLAEKLGQAEELQKKIESPKEIVITEHAVAKRRSRVKQILVRKFTLVWLIWTQVFTKQRRVAFNGLVAW